MEFAFIKRRVFLRKIALLMLLAVPGCFPFSEWDDKHLTGHYYLCEAKTDSGTWYLHFDDEEFGLADALISERVVQAGFNSKCIILKAAGTQPRFYIVPLTNTDNRDIARQYIIGSLKGPEFAVALRRISGTELPTFNADLTSVR